jgi:hypothetical protein
VKRILTLFVFLSLIGVVGATSSVKIDSLPQVFALGQYDGQPFEKLKAAHETQLLTVCRNDMETAYYLWVHVLKHIETQSVKTGFDLNGVKLWLYIFWNKDGSISNIAFFPKPNSKNFKTEDMAAFLTNFCKIYKFPLGADMPFSHYSTANFPVMVEKEKVTEKGGGGGGGNTPKKRD